MHPGLRLVLLIVSTTAFLASGSGGASTAGSCPIMTDVHSFNSQLQQLRGSGGALKDGVALLRKMDADGVSPNAVTYDELLEVARSGKPHDIPAALDIFSNLPATLRSKRAYALAMQLNTRVGRPDKATDLIAEAKSSGVFPDQEMIAAAAAAAASLHAQELKGERGERRDKGEKEAEKGEGGDQQSGGGGAKRMMSKAERKKMKKQGFKDGVLLPLVSDTERGNSTG
ncbi:hypothetical protein T484DRAFT_1892285, partial [Baffinella frigidus]